MKKFSNILVFAMSLFGFISALYRKEVDMVFIYLMIFILSVDNLPEK